MPFPIVFFPGVMGSRLYFEASDKFWDPDSTWRMLRWAPVWPFRSDDDNRRELHAGQPAGVLIDPLDGAVDGDGVAHGWGGVVWSFYGEYLKLLRDHALDGRAFAVAYDWRQDIRWLGEYAADKLRACLDVTQAAKVSIVTHSMGGLVTRAAFLVNPNLVARVDKVLHVCQPSVGAVILYRRMFTGMVEGLDGGGGLSDRAFRLLLGNDRAAFVGNMSGLPGPVELLPSRSFPPDADGQSWHTALDTGLPFSDLYGNAASPPGLNDVALALPPDARADLGERLLDLADFHGWLGATASAAPPETWLIYGANRDTETRIAFNGLEPIPIVTADGDGTVPLVSATAIGLAADRQFAVDDVEHAAACRDPRVHELTAHVFSPH